MGMESFKQRLSEYAVLTENTLQQYLPEETEDVVTQAMRYSLLAGGKRLRCALALEFCLALGGNKEDVLPFACALEMVHAYSLIHDDLPCMDDDDMRRGKPSCHIAFGEANALLAGDGLLTKAFEVMVQQSKIPPERTVLAIGVLAQAIGHHGMIGGQRMDLQNEGKEVGIEVIEQTNRLKTGALIIAAAQLGCIAAGADTKMTELAKNMQNRLDLHSRLPMISWIVPAPQKFWENRLVRMQKTTKRPMFRYMDLRKPCLLRQRRSKKQRMP